ncbi:glycosyltransferase [Paludisphaera borealis]|uniref:GT2 family glycosyltransferase n=1 Tax=Paludisphaera borealis TaxID=1387353 RepID=A0A1U7CK68_9BACT|nr:glycosyltransferase [Paludisphaera borealis]APW59334.1 GT2 family glycosyltransferase [Paludisphaera borealis]
MRISIAMTSYNSERFVGEQLESFANQTRKPDELVICDDQSTDRTSEILHEFARNSPFPTRVVVNEPQLGIIRNFEQAVRLSTGDLIFFSDHDDRWLPDKLAMHESTHLSAPDVGFVFSNAEVCDEKMAPRGFTHFDVQHLGGKRLAEIPRGRLFDMCIRSPRLYGCTMSFSASLKEAILPFPTSTSHDMWTCLILAALTPTRCIEKPLMKYRTHTSQLCGVFFDKPAKSDDPGGVDHFLTEIERNARYFSDALQRLRLHEHRLYRKDALRILEQKLAHLNARRKLRGTLPTRVGAFCREMLNGRYLRYTSKIDLINDVKRVYRDGRAR